MAGTEHERTWHALRELLGAKWTLHVLDELQAEGRGFNELERTFEGMTATMLSRRLGELQCHGLVDRAVEPTTPPRTRYELTTAGQRVAAILEELSALTTVVDETAATPNADCCTDHAPEDCRTTEEGACVIVPSS